MKSINGWGTVGVSGIYGRPEEADITWTFTNYDLLVFADSAVENDLI